MKLECSTVFVFLNYSTSFSNDDFSSFTNSTKEARLLRNEVKINLSQFIIQIYKHSYTALRTKVRVMKVKRDLLHIVSQINQSKTNHLTFLTGIYAK